MIASTRSRFRQLVTAALLASLALAACGGDDDAEPAAAPSDDAPPAESDAESEDNEPTAADDADDEAAIDGSVSCSLITAEEVAALGYDVESGPTPNELAPGDECGVAVILSDLGGAPVALTVYSAEESVALGPDLYGDGESVTGIGAEAWYVPSLRVAQARLDDGRVISIQDVPGQASRDGHLELLRSAVERAG